MAIVKRKVKRFVIDVNSYVTIFINKETDWLLQYIVQNSLEIFIDSKLLDELARVLTYPKIKKILPLDTLVYIAFVKIISTHINTKPTVTGSPDIHDDYLFDIALAAHAKLLVTGDKALLDWSAAPVQVISLTDFRVLF